MSTSANLRAPSSNNPPIPPKVTTLDIVQFDPANAAHYVKAPVLFRTLQGRFADAALSTTADVYAFADQCIFLGAVVHDPTGPVLGSEQNEGNNNMELDSNNNAQNQSSRSTRVVGLFYVHSSTASAKGEMNIGLVLDSNFDELACGFFVVYETLHMVFNVFNCHRAQVAIIEDGKKSRKLRDLVVSMGFSLEGTKKLSVFSPLHSSWKDVMYFAMLDTEWVFKRFDQLGAPIQPRSAWDEMLARHNREREELLATEDGHTLKRTSSAETIRVAMTEGGAPTDSASVSGAESDLSSQPGEPQSRRASLSSQPGAGRAPRRSRPVINPFASDLDGTESSSSSRRNPFDTTADESISWASVIGGFQAPTAASPPASSFAAPSNSGANADDPDNFSMYVDKDDDHGAIDGRTLLRRMMEESLSGQNAVAGPSRIREWLDSTSNLAPSSTSARDGEPSNAVSASGGSDNGEVHVDSDLGVISDGSIERDELNDEWEVLSGEP